LFGAQVAFADAGEYEVEIRDPADAKQERELVWYFEEYLRFPFLDWDRRDAATRAVADYGQALFAQVFGGEAAYDYRRMKDQGFDDCRVEIIGSAAFHRLHWETLRDPGADTPLGVRVPITRRVGELASRFDLPTDRATLNVLVVSARPDGPKDIGYRTISRPLLDAMRQAHVPVAVDLVRPGTWQALKDALRSATAEHGSGWFQVVHFDLHGLFSDHQGLQQQRRAGRLLFEPGEVPAFDGRQAMLFFETGTDGTAQAVTARMVAELLAEHRVPVAVLNACQSATQTASEAGLAQHLAQAGVPVSVGMAYSVTVSAARRAMPVLYSKLAAGRDPVEAAHAARVALFDDRTRRAYFEQDIELEDWILPVVFGQRPFAVRLREMTPQETVAFHEREAVVGEEPAPRYGFVGRDLDVQAIERRLLLTADSNLLLVKGMAGAGKSTLLTHLGWWWQRTGLVERVFAFSYEDRAWSAAQIVREIAKSLLTPNGMATFDSMGEAAQAAQIAQLLRATRYLLILDNTESVTASPAAIPHALDARNRALLTTFLQRLRGGKTLVLVGSRQEEAWLPAGSGGYPLPGLDPQAASQLVDRILTDHDATRFERDPQHRDAMAELVKLLGGYPLPLTVVLPSLATSTPAEILAQLRTGDTDADPVGLIRRAIEYSHGGLDPAVQRSMLLLAPFTATIPTGQILSSYQELLEATEPVRDLGQVDLAAAVAETARVGLTAPHPVLSDAAVQVVPVLPYFLRTRLTGQPDLAAAATQAHYQLHDNLAATLHELLTARTPNERATGQAVTSALYANLTAALDHAVRTGQSLIALLAAVEEFLDQAQQHASRRQLLDGLIAAYSPPTINAQRTELAFLHNLAGHIALGQNRLDDAHRHYTTDLGLKLAVDDRHNAARTYHQLGMVAQKQRRFDEARRHYQQALDIKLELDDRHSAANTFHHLGMVAHGQRRFDEAKRHYQQALDFYLEFRDRHSAAGTYGQLGLMARAHQRFDEAKRHYQQALEIYLDFGDRPGAGRTYHNLGVVAQEQRRFDEARRHYQQGLDIKLELGDRHGAANTYHNLAVIAQAQRRFDEARRHFQQALDIYLEFDDRYQTADVYHNLGVVAIQGDLDEARQHFQHAHDIYLEFGDRHNATRANSNLVTVLMESGRPSEAAAVLVRDAASWRRESGSWPVEILDRLRQVRTSVSTCEFAAAIDAVVPSGLADELKAQLKHDSDSAHD
jgi:tetratricopeptide (TPR) repeat protein